MENNIRFRNHISVIFERVIKTAVTAIFVFAASFVNNMEEIPELTDILIFLGVALACILIPLVWQYIIWAKTYISIQDNALVLEKNTLNRKKNTIGLANISNINLEQNLFEMALGTCKLKLDTNTLTTADQTDVNIVLKKTDAEKLRAYLLGLSEEQEAVKKTVTEENALSVSSKDIFLHGLFSLNLGAFIVFILTLVSGILLIDEMRNAEDTTVFEVLVSIIMIVWFLGGMIWKLVKEFIKYLEFSIERREDKVYLEYGIIKRITYSIPVEKINAVRLNQTMLARMGKRYMVEVVNVGMGNDEEEQHSFFLPYGKGEKIEEQLKMLLPEFKIQLTTEGERQPKGVWAVWTANGILWVSGTAAIAAIGAEFLDSGAALVGAVAAVILCIVLLRFTAYMTDSVFVEEQFLKISQGHFGKYILFVKYDKIQFLTMKQCVVAKKYGIEKGQIHLLAAAKNQTHNLPYMQEEKMKEICKYVK